MSLQVSSLLNNVSTAEKRTKRTKMNSLYQMHSKMLHSTKVIILVEKKKVAWLGFELTTSILEGESANHYTMDSS